MSAITADGANAPSHLPQMQAVATQSNGPHQVKYVLTRGPNNAIRASPAMPNTPIITIRQEGGTLRATTSAQGQVQFVHNGQQYVSSSHHVGGNPMQSHLARRDVAVGHLNSVNVPSTVNVTGGNTGVPLLLRKVDPISQQLQSLACSRGGSAGLVGTTLSNIASVSQSPQQIYSQGSSVKTSMVSRPVAISTMPSQQTVAANHHQQQLLSNLKGQQLQAMRNHQIQNNSRLNQQEQLALLQNLNKPVAMAPANIRPKNKVMMLPPYLLQNTSLPKQSIPNIDREKMLESISINNNNQIGYKTTNKLNSPAASNLPATSMSSFSQSVNGLSTREFSESTGDDNNTPDTESSVTEDSETPGVFNAYISLRNVVASFQVKCYLTLRKIALSTLNVEYKRECGRIMMKLRKPEVTANIWSSGKITCTGAKSASEAKVACRRIARILQKIGFNAKFSKFKVNNVLATTSLPFGVLLSKLAQTEKIVQYEPELHPAAVVRFKDISGKPIAKVFSTGSVTLTANNVQAVQDAVVALYSVVEPYKTAKSAPASELTAAAGAKRRQNGVAGGAARKQMKRGYPDNEFGFDESDSSDESQCSEDEY